MFKEAVKSSVLFLCCARLSAIHSRILNEIASDCCGISLVSLSGIFRDYCRGISSNIPYCFAVTSCTFIEIFRLCVEWTLLKENQCGFCEFHFLKFAWCFKEIVLALYIIVFVFWIGFNIYWTSTA